MADKKISALPAATTPLAGTEVLPIVQSGVTDKVSVSNLTAGRDISALSATLSNGNLVISTAGKGIDFSANTHAAGMTSELLDWYEEGTWTPTQGTFDTWTSPTFDARYTRVGNQVTLFFKQTGGTIAAGAASKYIEGIPFAPSVPATGLCINGSVVTVSNIILWSDSKIYFVSDTGSQTGAVFTISYTV